MTKHNTTIAMTPLDMRRTFALQAYGSFDPTARWEGETFKKAFTTPEGVSVVTLRPEGDGVHITISGDGSENTIREVAELFSRNDSYESFCPQHKEVEAIHRRLPGLRILPMPWLFDVACSSVIQQRIKTRDAFSQWAAVARQWGQPCDEGLVCWPGPKDFSQIPLHDLIGKGIDPKRARTMLALAKEWSFIGRPLSEDLNKLRLRLRRIVGVGEWTTNMILGFGLADLDAVPVGDLYLPSMVCSLLSGDSVGSDERMLELLECYRPYRFRVVRLLYSAHFKRLSKA